jgi:hypothetical protein
MSRYDQHNDDFMLPKNLKDIMQESYLNKSDISTKNLFFTKNKKASLFFTSI